MIDGGPSGVYAPHLKPRLEQIRAARGLRREEPLGVDLLMISHVDDDHIQGILDLTKELLEAKAAQRPLPLRVLDFWHNSFDSIIDNTPDELTAAFKSHFGAASTAGDCRRSDHRGRGRRPGRGDDCRQPQGPGEHPAGLPSAQ